MDLRPWGRRGPGGGGNVRPLPPARGPAGSPSVRAGSRNGRARDPGQRRDIPALGRRGRPDRNTEAARLHHSHHQASGTIGVIRATSASTRAGRRPTLGSEGVERPPREHPAGQRSTMPPVRLRAPSREPGGRAGLRPASRHPPRDRGPKRHASAGTRGRSTSAPGARPPRLPRPRSGRNWQSIGA